jgi:tetratricopeptide (TPR) repeat protein
MNGLTDFQVEMRAFELDLEKLRPSALANPMSGDHVTKYVYRLYQRAALSGNLEYFQEVETELNGAVARLGPAPDLCLLKANLDFKLHRVAETKLDLQMSDGLAETPQGKAISADIVFQEGNYQEARKLYEALVDQERTWDNLSRLAHLRARMGDVASADQLYVEAEDELTAKEMRSFSWVELQRGLLHSARGRFPQAREHYDRANRGYSGYWLVEEHIANLLAAEHKLEEAASLYRDLLKRVPKPEIQQALGDIYRHMGKQHEAEECFQKALAVYLQSAGRGDVHYYHHLVDFYCDAHRDAEQALNWAGRDLELRNNSSTQAAMARALHLAGRNDEARQMIDRALASGAREPGLFLQAGKIHSASGGNSMGEHYLKLAAELNPHHSAFHVHHH